jgi:hypothetical protein
MTIAIAATIVATLIVIVLAPALGVLAYSVAAFSIACALSAVLAGLGVFDKALTSIGWRR